MKIVRSNQTKFFHNGEACLAIEYPLGDKDMNGAIIKLSGKYPESGWVVNTVCKELAYIIKGSGSIKVKGKKQQTVTEGDLILINPGDYYYWAGNLEMFVPCTPAWYPEQHQEVRE